MIQRNKIVYIAFSSDIIHHGILKLFEKAKAYGDLVVGVLTDDEISKYRTMPISTLEQRVSIVKSISQVSDVIVQESNSYKNVLEEIQPDFIIHGDDWKTGILSEVRKELLILLKDSHCQLIELPYSNEYSNEKLANHYRSRYVDPVSRKTNLKKLIDMKSIVRAIEAHNGISSLIVENAKVYKESDIKSFDAIWISSLTDSTAKGKPDIELVDMSSRVQTIQEVMEVSTKPIIFDGDTGGQLEHIPYSVRTLERLGVSAFVIEDKKGLKRNSLFGTSVKQELDSIENFSLKIKACTNSRLTDDFMIIARIESLVLGKPIEDAIERAEAYISAGADGILIHSKDKDTTKLRDFCSIYSKLKNKKPLILVPTAYSQVTEKELINLNVDIVIYANHLIRSAYPAMMNTAIQILSDERSLEASEKYCMSIKDIISLIPDS